MRYEEFLESFLASDKTLKEIIKKVEKRKGMILQQIQKNGKTTSQKIK